MWEGWGRQILLPLLMQVSADQGKFDEAIKTNKELLEYMSGALKQAERLGVEEGKKIAASTASTMIKFTAEQANLYAKIRDNSQAMAALDDAKLLWQQHGSETE